MSLAIINLFSFDIDEFFSAYVSDDFKQKKIVEKKNVAKFFLVKPFSIHLKSSETHFDMVASKIGAKLNNLVLFCPFFTLF